MPTSTTFPPAAGLFCTRTEAALWLPLCIFLTMESRTAHDSAIQYLTMPSIAPDVLSNQDCLAANQSSTDTSEEE